MVHGEDRYVCVPVQGVGNTANEAVLGTLVPRERKVLIVDNGFYGARLREIAAAIGVPVRGARAAVDRAGHGRAARCRARGRCRDQPRDRLPRRHRHRPAQSDRAAGRGGQTARRRPDRGRDRVVRRSADRCRRLGSRGDRRVAEQMARGPAGHRPRGREARGARGRGRPGALVLPGSASAMAELRARRALAVHAAGPGHRRPGRGAAPACAGGPGGAPRAGAPQLALPGRRAARAWPRDVPARRGRLARDRDVLRARRPQLRPPSACSS